MISLKTVSAVPAACFAPTVAPRTVRPFPSIPSVRQARKGGLYLHLNSSKSGLILQNASPGFRPLRVENANAGRWEEENSSADLVLDSVRKLFDRLPEPAKRYPWSNAVVHFFSTVLGLVIAVAKCLSVPLLFISSLSEMSYCAHERKMLFILVSFLAGVAVARAFRHTVTEVSSDFKEEEFPWHLLLMAAFFVLLKIPGPYYPHLGRLAVPHFANGGLWGTLWYCFLMVQKGTRGCEAA